MKFHQDFFLKKEGIYSNSHNNSDTIVSIQGVYCGVLMDVMYEKMKINGQIKTIS